MILETKQTTVAYRCPHCGTGVMSAVNPFLLGRSMVRLKCECGNSAMEITPTSDGKIRMSVPCLFCPKPHSFTVTEKLFYGQDLFVLPCPYTDLNVGVIGEINHVKAELSRGELELADLMEKHGIDSFAALHGESEECFVDPQVLEVVLFVVRDLDEEGKIYCRCGEGEEREYDAEILSEGVRVTCRRCGASTLIPAGSVTEAQSFLECDALHLK